MSLYVKNKNRKTAYFILMIALAGGVLMGWLSNSRPVFAQAIKQIPLTVSLFDSEDQKILNGSYTVRFALYTRDRSTNDAYPSDADADARVWQETQVVKMENGIFRVFLGDVNPLPENVRFDQTQYFLGMRVESDDEMVPRKRLGAVPLALDAVRAQNALTAIDAQALQGRVPGTRSGDLLILSGSGKIDLKALPTGQGSNQLVLGNDTRLHEQNTDTGTSSNIFTLGDGAGLGENIDLRVSSATGPALRYNGSLSVWQLANDGVNFSEVFTANSILSGVDGAGATSSASGLEWAGDDSNRLALLQGCANGQGLAWNDTSNAWECGSFAAGLSGVGTTGYATYWSGTDSIGSEAFLSPVRGGTGVDGSTVTDGQLLIGDGANDNFSLATLTAGSGALSVVNAAGSVTLDMVLATAGITPTTFSASGLEITTSGLRMIGGCVDDQVLAWNEGLGVWFCSNKTGGTSDWTSSGSVTYLTDTTDSLAIGGSDSTNSRFYFDSASGNQIIFEGTGADDANETTLIIANPTQDNTFTLPNVSGTLITTGNLSSITATGTITSGTWNGTAIGAQYGGTGLDTSAATGVPIITAGTWSVSATLGVAQGGTNTATIGSAGSLAYSTGSAYAFSGVGTTGQALISGGTGAPTWFAPTAGSVLFAGTSGILAQDNANYFWDDTNNRLGIGTASPSSTLDIQGLAINDLPVYGSEFLSTPANWTTTGGWSGDNTTGFVHAAGVTSLSYSTAAVSSTKYQISYSVSGYSAGSFSIDFGGQSISGLTASGAFGPTTTSTSNLVITPTTNFVGTITFSIKAITGGTTPSFALRSSDGLAKIEMRSNIALGNTFVGRDAGSYTTTGVYNTALGISGLSVNTTGYYNTALGVNTLRDNTTGYENTATGMQALLNNTTGYQNTALGRDALRVNTTGYQNIAIGFSAGRYIANGSTPNQTSDSSIYVGYNAMALASGDTNEIVIGTSAIGNGSNSVTLGNSSIVKTILQGNVGIGDTTPSALFTVGNGDLFQVNSSGAIAAATGITSSGTITFSGLSTAGIVTNTSGGVLGTVSTVPVANGGTNAATIGSAGSLAYSTGSAYAFSGVGTTGQALISGGTGAPTWFAPTAGSVLFAGTGGILAQDNANYFWDDTNNRLGIGTATPAAMLSLYGTSNALRLSYDGSNYNTLSTTSGGDFSLVSSNVSESQIVVGSGSSVDASFAFDGASNDYFSGVDHTTGSYMVGSGFTVQSGNAFLTITSAGLVGIGTATPTGKLHASVPSTAVTATTHDGYFENLATNATTNAINKSGLYVISTGTFTGGAGTATNNYGIYVATTSGGDNNYQIYDQSGAYLSTAGTWTNAPSYRAYKEGFTSTASYLDRLMTLDVNEWQYKNEEIDGMNRYDNDQTRHASPFLDDFYATFMLGDPHGVNVQDLAGVALASVKELNTRFIAQNTSNTEGLAALSLVTDANATTLSGLQDSVDSQLLTIASELNTIKTTRLSDATLLATAQSDIATLQTDANTLSTRTTALEMNLSTMQDQIDTLTEFFTAFDLGQVLTKDMDGNVDLLGGILAARVVETGGIVVVNAVEDAPTIGTAIVYPVAKDDDEDGNDDYTDLPLTDAAVVARDGKYAEVLTQAMVPMVNGSRIFTSFKGNPGAFSWVDKIQDGNGDYVGFKVRLADPVSEPVKLDWWLIEQK